MRRQCTPENPYTEERNKRELGVGWEHQEAHEVGDQKDGYPGGDIVRMRCVTCGTEWNMELPQ